MEQGKTFGQKAMRKNSIIRACAKYAVLSLLMFFSAHTVNSQIGFDELEGLMQQKRKHIVVLATEQGCMPCLMQVKQLDKDKNLSKRLSQEFYYIRADAHERDTIVFDRQKYANAHPGERNVHNDFFSTFAEDDKGNMPTPTWLFFDREYHPILRFYGLLKSSDIERILDKMVSVDEGR